MADDKQNLSATETQSDWQPHTHEMQYHPFTYPTCDKKGNISYYQCVRCGNYYYDEKGTDPVPDRDLVLIDSCHTLQYYAEIPPTCTQDGHIAHWKCGVCNLCFTDYNCRNFVRQQFLVVPKLGHQLVYYGATTSDCMTQGHEQYWQCNNCGTCYRDKEGSEIVDLAQLMRPLAGHNLQHIAHVEPTCSREGNIEYYMCKKCGRLFADDQGNTELQLSDVTLPVLQHTTGQYTYCDSDMHANVCSKCGEVVDKQQHTFVEGKCTLCGYDSTVEQCCQYEYDNLTHSYVLSKADIECDSITIPSKHNDVNISAIGAKAFCNNTVLTLVKFASGVSYIDSNAFANCVHLTNVQLPFTLKMLGEKAFCNCQSLTSLYVPRGVFHIESDALRGCSGITEVKVEEGNRAYESNGTCIVDKDYQCVVFGTANANIPDDGSVISIGEYAFCDNQRLADIQLPDNILRLSKFAFANCTALHTVHTGNGVHTIGSHCFDNCTSLATLTLSDNLVNIHHDAFRGCKSLSNIVLGSSLRFVSDNAFDKCDNLRAIYYCGTQEQWQTVTVGNNALPHNAKVYYYSQDKPDSVGRYWHYQDGQPTVW